MASPRSPKDEKKDEKKTRKRREKEANRNLPSRPKPPDTLATVICRVTWGPFFAGIFFWFFAQPTVIRGACWLGPRMGPGFASTP